jgi:hypothetical protein
MSKAGSLVVLFMLRAVGFFPDGDGTAYGPGGWDNWRDPEKKKTACYAECESSGPGAVEKSWDNG